MLISQDELREACQNDLHVLCTQFLAYKDWDLLHDELEVFLDKPASKKALLLPRSHLKTSIVTIGKTIQYILKNPNVRILIANQVWDIARKMLFEIKEHLDGKSQLPQLFGEFKSDLWNQDVITIRQRRKALKEPTIATTGVEAEQTGGHYDVILLDDLTGLQNSQTPEQREKTKRFRRSMINLLEPGGTLIEVGCLVAGAKVLKADGTWKNIEDMKVGEKVVSHDSIETVEAMIPQGKADVYEVKCKNFKLEATANHPFLTSKGFVRLEDLKVGDRVYVLGNYNVGGNGIPSEDSWMLGFMFGDGWITRHPNAKGSMRWVTCFAKGIDESLNQRALNFFKDKFNVVPKLTRFGYYRTEVAEVGRYFESLGFFGGAKTKRIPSWVFGKNNKIKNLFVDGFIDADGTDATGANGMVIPSAVEISNKLLIEDLKYLATSAGRRVSNIYERTRVIQAPHSPEPVTSETFHIGIGTEKHLEKWREVKIQAITHTGVKDVYDLSISNTHNFVANGYVVHNTRWHLDDTFSEIFEKEAEYYDIMNRQIIENGKIIFPKKFNKKFDPKHKVWLESKEPCMDYIDHLKKSMTPGEFAAQYMNNPIDEENQLFKPAYFKYYERRPERLFVSMTIDPAISEKHAADYFAINISGMDEKYDIYVLDTLRGHWNVSEAINNIFSMYQKWHPSVIGMETISFQKAIKAWLENAMRERGVHFPVTELKRNTNESKEFRIKALEPFYREGKVYHAPWMKNLEMELATFPKGKHDDEIDALASQLDLLVPGDSVSAADIPTGSWEDAFQQAKKLNRHNDFFHETLNG